jgi:hypothetical protein
VIQRQIEIDFRATSGRKTGVNSRYLIVREDLSVIRYWRPGAAIPTASVGGTLALFTTNYIPAFKPSSGEAAQNRQAPVVSKITLYHIKNLERNV